MQIIDKIIFKPQTLYKDNKKVIEELYIIIKNYYNLGNSLNNKTLDSETLITKKCDIEQIWQQLFFSANILLKKINKIDLDEIKENKVLYFSKKKFDSLLKKKKKLKAKK